LHDAFNGGFVGGVEGACVDVDAGVEGGEFAFVEFEVRGGEVAEVECAGAVSGKLMR
jgi:hypothetical protein